MIFPQRRNEERVKPNSFKSHQRIRNRKLYRQVIEKGSFGKRKNLNLWGLIEAGGANQVPRLGIIVSRKVSLKATERNLWKRRIREAFRTNRGCLPRGLLIVVQAKRRPVIPGIKEIAGEIVTFAQEKKDWPKKP